jgi:hypothetical protein
MSVFEIVKYFKIVWYNAWRTGLVLISRYVFSQFTTLICSIYFSLEETASYGLSIQITTIIYSLSFFYYELLRPSFARDSISEKPNSIKRLSKAWVVYTLLFFSMTILVLLFAKYLLLLLNSQIRIDFFIYLCMSCYFFLESNHTFFASYVETITNSIPYMSSFIISAFLSILLTIVLIRWTNLKVYALILSPFLIHLSYNNWKWPCLVLKSNNLSLLGFLKCGIKEFLILFKGRE